MKTLRVDLHAQAERIVEAVSRAALPRPDAAPDDLIVSRSLWPAWAAGPFAVGDVRVYADQVWRCVQGHDSTGQSVSWAPGESAALWAAYHARDAALARPWVRPLGASDAYQTGEVMIWTDGRIYRCRADATVWDPTTLPSAWELVP